MSSIPGWEARDEACGSHPVHVIKSDELLQGTPGGELHAEQTADPNKLQNHEHDASTTTAAGIAGSHGPDTRGLQHEATTAVKRERPILTLAAAGLPTATVTIGDQVHELTIDTGGRYSIVGQRLKGLDERLHGLPPVAFVQGL